MGLTQSLPNANANFNPGQNFQQLNQNLQNAFRGAFPQNSLNLQQIPAEIQQAFNQLTPQQIQQLPQELQQFLAPGNRPQQLPQELQQFLAPGNRPQQLPQELQQFLTPGNKPQNLDNIRAEFNDGLQRQQQLAKEGWNYANQRDAPFRHGGGYRKDEYFLDGRYYKKQRKNDKDCSKGKCGCKLCNLRYPY